MHLTYVNANWQLRRKLLEHDHSQLGHFPRYDLPEDSVAVPVHGPTSLQNALPQQVICPPNIAL